MAHKIQKKLSKIKVREDEDGELFFKGSRKLKSLVDKMISIFTFICIFTPYSTASSVSY